MFCRISFPWSSWFVVCVSMPLLVATTWGEEATGSRPSDAKAWSQWRGPDRDGLVQHADWPDSLNGHLKLVWEQKLSPSYSGPVIVGDEVITTETVDKKYERVTALKLSDGATDWTAQWEGSMAVPFFAASNGDWIRSTPASDGNRVVVAGMRDLVICLDNKTGKELWRVDLPKQHGTPLQAFGCVCSPLIDGDSVYLQSGGGLIKLSLEDGQVIWKTLETGSDMMTVGAFSSPIIATIQGKRQLVVATRDRLVGVELADGKEIWGEAIESFRGMNILTPVMVGDRVFSSAHSGRSRLFEIGVGEGGSMGVEQLWENKAQAYMSTPIVVGDHLYMHMKNERFVCMDLQTGEERWTSKTFGKYWSMVGNVDEKKILALDSDGTLRLIAADPSELRILDEFKVAEDSWAHLAVQGSTIVVRALDAIRVYSWQ
jgi:outer membrane protein assembly factor BamB